MSKNIVGSVIQLFISKKGIEKRISKEELQLDLNGVNEDKFYNKNINRSVLLASLDSYALAKQHNIDISYGTLGENILIDFNPYSLDMGTMIQIGEVLFEVTQACTICDHLSVIDESLPNLLKKDRGIFVKVIKEGVIQTNDKVYLN